MRVPVLCLGAFLLMSVAQPQDAPPKPLSLQEAIRIALQRNGTIAAARFDTVSARSRLAQSQSDFFPTISQSYTYNDNFTTGFGDPNQSARTTNFDTVASMTLLDSGQRMTAFRKAQASLRGARYGERSIYRDLILLVMEDYYNALRQQEAVRVGEAQVARAQTQYDITKAQVDVGDIAPKELLQAETDLANARVSLIQARQGSGVAFATLRADLVWDDSHTFPPLEASAVPVPPSETATLNDLYQQALERRPDIKQTQEQINTLRYAIQQAQIDSRISFKLSGNAAKSWEPGQGDNRGLALTASIPIFDAGFSRELVRDARSSRDAAESRYSQSLREIRADIESKLLTLNLQKESLVASQTALKLARNNYEAATESRRLGAGSLADVINAELALATAETNAIQAQYSYLTAQAQLQHAIGAPMPEEPAP